VFFCISCLFGRITVYEGKYHQIRRMLAAIGNRAKTVHRVQVGQLTLGDLPQGQWRLLTKEEVDHIMGTGPSPSEIKTSDLD
jgi:16S rRNA pseudouridine516 synthase